MWTLILQIALVLLSVWLVKAVHAIVRWWLHRQDLYGLFEEATKPHWFRGHVGTDRTQFKETVITMVKAKPRVFLRQLGPVLLQVVLAHPETIADGMRVAPPKMPLIYGILKSWLGNGLVTSSGKRWSRDRKLMEHLFTPAMLKKYVPVYKSACSTMLDLWQQHAGKSIDVSEYFPMLTFDVILQCAVGVKTSCQGVTDPDSPISKYHHAVQGLTEITGRRMRQPWYYSDFVFSLSPLGRRFKALKQAVSSFSEGIISERRKHLQQQSLSASQLEERTDADMLDILLTVKDSDGTGMSDVDIREQVDTFLFAGHDTTSAALQWALLFLSRNVPVQDKCRAEVLQMLEECGGLEEFRHADLTKLPYLTQTAMETLRMGCVVPGVSRQTVKPCQIDGITCPVGSYLQTNIIGVHHNPQVWDDPECFNPDRFSPDKGPRHPYAYIPFSCGPRGCIGKNFAMDEMRVVLSMILARYTLRPDPDAPDPYYKMFLVASPSPPVSIIIEDA